MRVVLLGIMVCVAFMAWELYDLEKDPREVNNLYGKRKYSQLTGELKAELQALIAKYEDEDARKILAAKIKN